MGLVSGQAEQRPQADADQAAGQRGGKPHPAVQRSRRHATDQAAEKNAKQRSDPDDTPPTKAPILQPKPSRAPQPISKPPMPAASSNLAGGQQIGRAHV